jgi:NAD(P)-dependent dehydrogenase (short-subunit alcohol dehydrogenase family)
MAQVVVVGGTSGIGTEIARHFAAQGDDVVLTGRALSRAETVAKEIGGAARGLALDLSRPYELAEGLADVGPVDHLVLTAMERDLNSVEDYDIGKALELATVKIVGYTEVIHALHPRLAENSSIVLFGGMAKDRPYPGSTTVSAVNGGISSLARTLAVELAPVRVNALHPGPVGDSPFWLGKGLEALIPKIPAGHLVSMSDVVDATVFLLRNPSVNGIDLAVDGGYLLT